METNCSPEHACIGIMGMLLSKVKLCELSSEKIYNFGENEEVIYCHCIIELCFGSKWKHFIVFVSDWNHFVLYL